MLRESTRQGPNESPDPDLGSLQHVVASPMLAYAEPAVTLRSRLPDAVHLAAAAYPVLLLLAFYGSWGMAWVDLGHRPRVALDDPKIILGPLYFLSAMVVLALPLGAALGTFSILLCLFRVRLTLLVVIWATAIVTIWGLAIAVLRLDAHSVVEWWLD